MTSKLRIGRLVIFAFAALGLFASASTAAAQTVLTACGSLATGDYVLGANITASGDCFTITGPNVSIDFKGKTLTGDGSGSGISDDGVARNFLVVSNGKIRNFNKGINLVHSGLATFNKMDVSGNASDGIYTLKCCDTFNSVKANNNGGDGIRVDQCCAVVTNTQTIGNGGDGMDLRDCCYSVNKSNASNNGGNGVFMHASSCCQVVSNTTASGNGGDGIHAENGDNYVNSCKVSNNGGDGVFMEGCCNFVSNSTISGSGGNGVELQDGFNLVSASKVSKSGGTGIKMDDDDQNQITASTSSKNNVGASLLCPGTVVALKASGNPGGNLLQSGGTCTVLDSP